MAGDHMPRGGRWASALLFALLAAPPANAQTPRQVTLNDALRSTLDRAPAVQSARETVNLQEGSRRLASGTFDLQVLVTPTWDHHEDYMSGASLREERGKRLVYENLSIAFGQISSSLDTSVRSGRARLPMCPSDRGMALYVATLPGRALPVPLCQPAATWNPSSTYTSQGITDIPWLRGQNPLDLTSTLAVLKQVSTINNMQVSAAVLEGEQRSLEMLDQLRAAAFDASVRTGLYFERLGAISKYEYSNGAGLSAQVAKALRNGSVFQFLVNFDGRGGYFRDKPLDPLFGGRPVSNRFRSKLQLVWLQPFRRGRGATTVRAPERAAAKNAEASRFAFQQSSSDQALATANAYFNLIAAQDSEALNVESLQRQRQTLENTTKLVAAGEVPASDVSRIRARVAEQEAAVLSSRLAVVKAREALANEMGLTAAELGGLRAAETFPGQPAAVDLDALAREAVAHRADVHAAGAFRDSSRLLLDAARAETRSRFDVTFNAGVAQAYYGPQFISLIDEYGDRAPADSYVRYFSMNGIGRAFGRTWEPIGGIRGVFELPFKNNARLGRLAQARAAAGESEIRLADITRVVSNSVLTVAEQVRRARVEWEQAQESVVQYESTWDATQRLRAAGDMTLVDTLLTEQQLTQARLTLVEAKRAYASALARFRRETGTLVTFTDWSAGAPNLAGVVTQR